MPNVQDIKIIWDSGVIAETVLPIDLMCLDLKPVKLVNGYWDVTQNPPVKYYNAVPSNPNIVKAVAILDCNTSDVKYLSTETMGLLQSLLNYDYCKACKDANTLPMTPTAISFNRPSITLDNGQSDFEDITVIGVSKIKMTTIVLQTPIAALISVNQYVIDNDKIRVEVENQTGNDNVVIPQLDFIVTQI
jgi:hypothetical protein